jgi:hypothetical protein
MGYNASMGFPACSIYLDPAKQSQLLNGLTTLEQAIQALDKLGCVGRRVLHNLLTSDPTTVVQGAWARMVNPGYLFQGTFDNVVGSATNDAIDIDVFIPSAGVWNLNMNLPHRDDMAIVKLFIDTVQIGLTQGYDGYAAGLDPYAIVTVEALVLTAGKHTLRIKADGKNGLSSAHVIRLQAIEFVRTA